MSHRTGGDDSSRRSTSRDTSKARRTSKTRKGGSKATSLNVDETVAAGDEKIQTQQPQQQQAALGSKDAKSTDTDVVAQVGYGYVTQKDRPMMGRI